MKPLLLLTLAAFALLAACGDDDDGPAADVDGVWNGTYEWGAPDRSGVVCMDIDQDGRDIAGAVRIDSLPSASIGGRVANDTLSFVWVAIGTPTDIATTDASLGVEPTLRLDSGGTFSATVNDAGLAGTWTSTVGSPANGTWTATRSTAESCG